MLSRTRALSHRFGGAAASYERAAPLQRLVALALARRIGQAAPRPPSRILEIGCGTGLLTRLLRVRFPDALIVAADLAPDMLSACRRAMPDDGGLLLLAADGAAPALAGGFDLVCSSLALQWFAEPVPACSTLAGMLSPGGQLHLATLLDGSLGFWAAAHRAEGEHPRTPPLPSLHRLRADTPLRWEREAVSVSHETALGFLRGLRGIGADLPGAGTGPLGAGRLRRVMRRFEREHGAVADYAVGYGAWRRPGRTGVFVTGTDTGIGKTLVSACLVRAWDAEYWKPLQTGLDTEPDDTGSVRRLSGCAPERLHPPALSLRAPLSPEDAAAAEGVDVDASLLSLPDGNRALVVEGAGGVLVPLDRRTLTADAIGRFGLPVVLVARSTLGTINHTLLSLDALRARGVAILGVVLNGLPNPGNRAAIERWGGVRVLAELPWMADPGPKQVRALSRVFEPLDPRLSSAAAAPPVGPAP